MKMHKHFGLVLTACLVLSLLFTPVFLLPSQAANTVTVQGKVMSDTTSSLLLLDTPQGKMEIKIDNATDTTAGKILLPDQAISVTVTGACPFFHFAVQSSHGHDFVRETPMSEDLLIRHCSPTLAGIKTGNLFSCACPSRKDLTRDLCRLNKKLVPKGIRVLPLRVCKGRALIYAYRPNALESDLTDHRARALLLKYGYVPENPNGCVVHLIHRLRSEGEFPHEIGLFLSYPPEDVLGFICNRACNHKCVGCWKVYGDEQAARSIFEKYEMCSKIYSRQWQQGKSIEQLTVAG